MRAEFHPAAEQELAAAVTLGEQRSSGLGSPLVAEAERIVELLREAPGIGEPIDAAIEDFRCAAFLSRSFIASMERCYASSRCHIDDSVQGIGVGEHDR